MAIFKQTQALPLSDLKRAELYVMIAEAVMHEARREFVKIVEQAKAANSSATSHP